MTLWNTSVRSYKRPNAREEHIEESILSDDVIEAKTKWLIADEQYRKRKMLDLTKDTYSFPLVWWFACTNKRQDIILFNCDVPAERKSPRGHETSTLLDPEAYAAETVDIYFRPGKDEITVDELMSKKDVEKLLHKKQVEQGCLNAEWNRRLFVGRHQVYTSWADLVCGRLCQRSHADRILKKEEFPVSIKLARISGQWRICGFFTIILLTYGTFALQVIVTIVVTRPFIRKAERTATYIETGFHCLAMFLIYAGLLDEINSLVKLRHADFGFGDTLGKCRSCLMINAITCAQLLAAVVNGFCSTLFIMAQRQIENIILFTFTLKMIVTIDETIMNAMLHFTNVSKEMVVFGVTLSWQVPDKQREKQRDFWGHMGWVGSQTVSNAKIWVALAMCTAFALAKTQSVQVIYCPIVEHLLSYQERIPESFRLPDEKICNFTNHSTNSSFLVYYEEAL